MVPHGGQGAFKFQNVLKRIAVVEWRLDADPGDIDVNLLSRIGSDDVGSTGPSVLHDHGIHDLYGGKFRCL